MIKITKLTSDKPGKRLLILGSIHGNERCGTLAIQRLLGEINQGAITLQRGSLTLIPNCNPEAYSLNKRYVEQNLNRAMMRHASPAYYEQHLMNFLCPMLEDCDVLLDIHSYTAGGPPFALRGPDAVKEQEEALIRALGVETMIYDFERVYTESEKELAPETPVGTTGYARKFGAIAATLECSQHEDPNGPAIAYQAIRNVLAYCQLTDEAPPPEPHNFHRIKLKQVRYREPDQQFAQAWRQMEFVERGATLVTTASGREIKAPFDSYMIMPHADCPVGEEWYYLGVEDSAPRAAPP